jgi:hypothetical protein
LFLLCDQFTRSMSLRKRGWVRSTSS